MDYVAFDSQDATHVRATAEIWTAACGADLALSERAAAFNTCPPSGVRQAGRLATLDGRPAGFVLASAMAGRPEVRSPEAGWIDAIAVLPEHQGRGTGSALLRWAETWLDGMGCRTYSAGGSVKTFSAGIPVALGTEGFFARRGYTSRAAGRDRSWDVARSLKGYQTPPTAQRGLPVEVRPAAPGDVEDLLTFLRREFPGRWLYECEEFFKDGGRPSDYQLLWSERGVDAFCRITVADSWSPQDRYFPWRLPQPWGQLGPIGVSADRRGSGYGAVVLDGGLRYLISHGVDGCVIDWTGLLGFYGKFGFEPYREYYMWAKTREEGTHD